MRKSHVRTMIHPIVFSIIQELHKIRFESLLAIRIINLSFPQRQVASYVLKRQILRMELHYWFMLMKGIVTHC